MRLLLGDLNLEVATQDLMIHCKVFSDNPSLLTTPYHVRSSVSSDSLWQFVDAVQGRVPPITPDNITDLMLLADEFGFAALATRLTDTQSHDLRTTNSVQQSEIGRLREEVAALRNDGAVNALEQRLAGLQLEVGEMRERHRADIESLVQENRALAQLTEKMTQAIAVLQHQIAVLRSGIVRMRDRDAAESSEEKTESSSGEESEEEEEVRHRRGRRSDAKERVARRRKSDYEEEEERATGTKHRRDGSSDRTGESDSDSESVSSKTTSESGTA
jgi:hypothetical protein